MLSQVVATRFAMLSFSPFYGHLRARRLVLSWAEKRALPKQLSILYSFDCGAEAAIETHIMLTTRAAADFPAVGKYAMLSRI